GQTMRRADAAEDVLLFQDGNEQVALSANGLRGSQEEEPPRLEREMEERDDGGLNVGFEVDQQIAAADQIQPGKRWISGHVLQGEGDRLAQALADLIRVLANF